MVPAGGRDSPSLDGNLRDKAAPGFLTATLLFTFAAALTQSRKLTVDGFLNLYAGRWIVDHGIPSTDPLTIAGQGRPWLDQQWISHAAFYLSWQVGGYGAVALLCALTLTLGFGLLFGLLRKLGVSPPFSALWTLGALVASLSSVTPRAQVFAFSLFVGLLFWLLSGNRSARRWQRWWAVPLLALWGNLHGSVLLGVALVASRCLLDAGAAARARERREAILQSALAIGAVAATLLNPYGTGIWSYYERVLTSKAIAGHVSEWRPLDVTESEQLPLVLFMLLSALVVLWSWRRRHRIRLDLLALAVLTVVLVFRSGRQEMWVAIVLAVWAADSSAKRSEGRNVGPALVGHALVAASAVLAAVAAVVVLTRQPAEFEELLPRRAVAAAATELRVQPNATLLGDESVTLLLWRYPEHAGRVAFDIRYEVYGERQLDSFIDFVAARHSAWQPIAADYDVLLAAKQWSPQIATAIANAGMWKVVFQDARGVVATSSLSHNSN